MNWLEKILPSCCSNRSNSLQPDIKKSTTSIADLNIVIHSEPERFDSVNSLKSNEIQVEEVKVDEERKESKAFIKIEKPNGISESRRSTNFTLNNSDSAILALAPYPDTLLCEVCSKEAQGYCPVCPNTRFCILCYPTQHKISSRSHKFIPYPKTSKRRPKALDSIIKIKNLM